MPMVKVGIVTYDVYIKGMYILQSDACGLPVALLYNSFTLLTLHQMDISSIH